MFGSVSRERDVGDIVSEHGSRNWHVILYIMIIGRMGHWTLDLTLCIIE